MNKAIKSFTCNPFLPFLVIMLCAQGCSSSKGPRQVQPDADKVREASIITNKCLLNYHDIPGSLSQRQECLNKASALLMDGYAPEIQNVARLCSQKLTQLAGETDAGHIDLNSYQQKRELLKVECAQAAQEAQSGRK